MTLTLTAINAIQLAAIFPARGGKNPPFFLQ